jgi:glutamate dehydrogenase (NAD(P)+)
METIWQLSDELGPEKILHLHNPRVRLRAIVVVDNVACGPSIGGLRMAPDVTLQECARLARAMTFKNAAAGLPHGGGKSVIFADPKMDASDKEPLIRAFACAIRDVPDYIVGPDMGTDEQCMGWAHDEIHRAVGLPRVLGGIPLDELGATGFGLAVAASVAQEHAGIELSRSRFAVQGFGSVGTHGARFLAERGATLVAACDSQATVAAKDGIDVAALIAYKRETGGVRGFPGASTLDRDAVVGVDCDVFVPAARPDVLRRDNVATLRAKLVISGANIPITAEAERMLADREVLVVPDFIANAGGVICAAVEYHGGSESAAFTAIREKIEKNTLEVLNEARRTRVLPRAAAVAIAQRRVRDAMRSRRW